MNSSSRFGMSQPTFVSSSGSSKNRFLKLETNTNVKSTTTTSSSCANNPFFSLPSYVTDFHLETQPADIPTDAEIKKDLAPKEDDFPPLSLSSKPAKNARPEPGLGPEPGPGLGTGLLYKNALLSKLGQKHYEEQSRIHNDMKKEIERKEERTRQLQLASKRERAVADLVSDFYNMSYDYDDNEDDINDRRRSDYDYD